MKAIGPLSGVAGSILEPELNVPGLAMVTVPVFSASAMACAPSVQVSGASPASVQALPCAAVFGMVAPSVQAIITVPASTQAPPFSCACALKSPAVLATSSADAIVVATPAEITGRLVSPSWNSSARVYILSGRVKVQCSGGAPVTGILATFRYTLRATATATYRLRTGGRRRVPVH
ncbi:MAG TPA: hypothetical protein GXX19_08915 [Syntrophomonadaceae bacterium]|nr:hypothetical protein [Syntrophomonadaceae bacterium]